MLSLGTVTSSAYYTSHLSRVADYYGAGSFLGSGADALKLTGQAVTRDRFRRLHRGEDPRDRSPLRRNTGRKVAWDATYSVPKSVSLVYAFGSDSVRRAVLDANQRALRQTIETLEAQFSRTRRGHGGRQLERAGLVAAAFLHHDNRAGDPQLHHHVVIMNAAHRADGTWGAWDSRGLYHNKKALGALYRAALSQELRGIGLETERDGFSFRVKGVPKRLEAKFSKRSEQIRRRAAELGVSDARSLARIALETRPHKQNLTPEELRREWCKEARLFPELRVERLFRNRTRERRPDTVARRAVLDCLERIEKPSFSRRELLERSANRLTGRDVSPAAIVGAVDSVLESRYVRRLDSQAFESRWTLSLHALQKALAWNLTTGLRRAFSPDSLLQYGVYNRRDPFGPQSKTKTLSFDLNPET